MGPGQVWTGLENLAPTRIRSPDRPVRSQSLYLLSYPDSLNHTVDDTKHRDMPRRKQTSETPPKKQEAASGGIQKIPVYRLPKFYVSPFLYKKCQK